MINLQKAIATVCGIGFIQKGAGSVAAAVYCVIWYLSPLGNNMPAQVVGLILVLAAGVWSAGGVEKIWEHDSNKVVIDEVAGMMIALLFVAVNVKYVVAGFVLFRFFDIVKPLWIKRMEKLPGGWGVMADDVLAGVYAWLLLGLVTVTKLL